MSVRSVAVRQAAKIRSERAAAFAVREAAIEELTVGFLEAAGQAEDVVVVARRRCEQIMAVAQASAEQSLAHAATAVTGLHEMGVPRAEIAQLTGLSVREVRDLLAPVPSPAPPAENDAGGDGTGLDRSAAEQQEAGADGAQDARGVNGADGPVSGEGEREDVAGQDPAGGPMAMAARGADAPAASL
jgi:hypothetical protein